MSSEIRQALEQADKYLQDGRHLEAHQVIHDALSNPVQGEGERWWLWSDQNGYVVKVAPAYQKIEPNSKVEVVRADEDSQGEGRQKLFDRITALEEELVSAWHNGCFNEDFGLHRILHLTPGEYSHWITGGYRAVLQGGASPPIKESSASPSKGSE